jgi:hypothetical protein
MIIKPHDAGCSGLNHLNGGTIAKTQFPQAMCGNRVS